MDSTVVQLYIRTYSTVLKDDSHSFGQDSNKNCVCQQVTHFQFLYIRTYRLSCSHTPIHGNDPVCEHILCAPSLSREDLKREGKQLRKDLRSKEKEKEEKRKRKKKRWKRAKMVRSLFTSGTLYWPKVYIYMYNVHVYKVCFMPHSEYPLSHPITVVNTYIHECCQTLCHCGWVGVSQ